MAAKYGILGQLLPSSASLQTLYTAPTNKRISAKVIACNRDNNVALVRISLAPNGAADLPEQYVVYDQVLNGNVAESTVTFTLGSGDGVRVRSDTGSVSFNLVGVEEDNT